MSRKIQVMKKYDQNYKAYIKVGEELGLKYPGGGAIENSEGTRVKEFINYISQEGLVFRTKYTLLELVLASMNDAIVDGIANCEVHGIFYKYIKPILNDDRYYPHIPYWISIKSKEDYPVGLLLESYMKDNSETEST